MEAKADISYLAELILDILFLSNCIKMSRINSQMLEII